MLCPQLVSSEESIDSDDGDGDFQQLEDPISEDHSSSDDFAS
jgi:hypothetical protein